MMNMTWLAEIDATDASMADSPWEIILMVIIAWIMGH